jgi:hypothetical protein
MFSSFHTGSQLNDLFRYTFCAMQPMLLATSNLLAEMAPSREGTSPASRSVRMRTIRALLLLPALLLNPACDDGAPLDPSDAPLDLGGIWRGAITVNSMPAQMTWTLTQSAAAVSGPALVALPTGIVLMNGALTGSLSGMTLTYTIDVPAGGIPLQPSCSGRIGGTSTAVSASNMSGSYAVTSSTCATGLTSGSFTLTK